MMANKFCPKLRNIHIFYKNMGHFENLQIFKNFKSDRICSKYIRTMPWESNIFPKLTFSKFGHFGPFYCQKQANNSKISKIFFSKGVNARNKIQTPKYLPHHGQCKLCKANLRCHNQCQFWLFENQSFSKWSKLEACFVNSHCFVCGSEWEAGSCC